MFACCLCYSQASWHGRLYFNLTDPDGNIITPQDAENNRVTFCIYSGFSQVSATIKYDSINKAFVYESSGISVYRSFHVIFENKILIICFPASASAALFIKNPIPVENAEIWCESDVLWSKEESAFKIAGYNIIYSNDIVYKKIFKTREEVIKHDYIDMLYLIPFNE
jgi:hypothetical protein